MASATRASEKRGDSSSHQRSNDNTTIHNLDMAAIRYKHYMADAQRMMAAANKKRAGQSNNNEAAVTSNQVHVALEALDRAEALHSQQRRTRSAENLQQALELYQDAIQVLLRFLRQPTSNNNNIGVIDKSTLQARIQTALTDAEQLKVELSQSNTRQSSDKSLEGRTRRKKKDKSNSPPNHNQGKRAGEATTTTMSSEGGGLFALFSSSSGVTEETPKSSKPASVLTRKPASPTSESSSPTSQQSATSSTSANRTRPAAATRAASAGARATAPPRTHASQPAPVRTRQGSPTSASSSPTSTSSSPTTQPQQKQRLTPQNQAMQHQILDDFYVPTSTLQKTTWDDVAGLQPVKQALQEVVILPLQRPDLFTGLRKPQNLLLFGPPGTGKTLLVRATASTSNALLFQCSAASLTSKWMGEAEKVVRALFQVAAAASEQHQTPALLFLDEVDSVLSNRSEGEHEASRRLKTEFMVQMEGLTKTNNNGGGPNVLVLACTNNPWDLDAAILRRFPRRLYVPMPDPAARQALLQHLLDTKLKDEHSLSTRDVRELAISLKGYSGSDIYAIASQAAFGPIREVSATKLQNVSKLRPVSRKDWDAAIQAAPPPSVTPKHLSRYKEWQTKNTT